MDASARFPLPDFVNLRHSGPYQPPTGNAQLLLEATLQSTALVLIAPAYWHSLPASAKLYLDHWSAWLRTPDLDFHARMQGKTPWTITVSSGARAEAQPLKDTLTLTAQYLRMHWGGLLFGTGSRPNDVQGDALSLHQARSFFSMVSAPWLAIAIAGWLPKSPRCYRKGLFSRWQIRRRPAGPAA